MRHMFFALLVVAVAGTMIVLLRNEDRRIFLRVSSTSRKQLACKWVMKWTQMNLSCLPAGRARPAVTANDARWPRKRCFKIPVHSKPSGSGSLWEYYHFLIDFAAPMFVLLQNEYRGKQKIVVLPDWYGDGKFSFQSPADLTRNMKPLADYLFRPLNVSFINWGSNQQYNALQCITLKFQSGNWSSERAKTYDRFRSYAHSLVFPRVNAGAPLIKFKNGIVLIRRGSISTSTSTCTGSCRRHLDESFFHDFTRFMVTLHSAADFRIVETDKMSLAEQIEIFSSSRMIIGMHGAGLSDSVFAQRGATVVELGQINYPCYEPLAKKLGLQYHHCKDTKLTSCLKAVVENSTKVQREHAEKTS